LNKNEFKHGLRSLKKEALVGAARLAKGTGRTSGEIFHGVNPVWNLVGGNPVFQEVSY
jgi:hypothetical protein